MNWKKRFLLILVALSLVLFAGCGQKEEINKAEETGKLETENEEVKEDFVEEYGLKLYEDRVEFVDGSGREVVIPKNPERVVVLYNSYLELWAQNGGKVVGRLEESKTQGLVPGTEDAEIIGAGPSDISVEKVISLEPDLIIGSPKWGEHLDMIEFWDENDIPCILLDYDGLEDYHKLVRLFTFLTDREDLYEENSVKVQKEIDEILAKVPEESDKKVLLMHIGKGISAKDSTFWVGQIVKDFNVTNIADNNEDELNASSFSKEVIVKEDPDFILTLVMGSEDKAKEKIKSELASDPAWNSLTAIQEDKLYFLDREILWFRPNNRYAESYLEIGKILYPEIFGELEEK